MDLLAVHTTVARQDQADALARAAVEQGLAACVQTEAIRSTYQWQGEITCDDEVRLVFKTTRTLYPVLEALLRELHPYDLPAIYALPVIAGTAEYTEWVRMSLRTTDQG